jgi:hypothetical protein
MTTFDHEKLDVYQIALEFVVLAREITVKLPTGRHSLADQLDRAATSVVLNIAEALGNSAERRKLVSTAWRNDLRLSARQRWMCVG